MLLNDKGDDHEVSTNTKEGLLVDKETGRMRSTY